jgi:hypothetical protein
MSLVAEILTRGDLDEFRRAWKMFMPGEPVPSNDHLEHTLHYARSAAESVPMLHRIYSHHWLCERNHLSGLPSKDRPIIVEAVGIAVMAQSPEMEPVAKMVQKAMADAVEECYADGDTDPVLVGARMHEAKTRTLRGLAV